MTAHTMASHSINPSTAPRSILAALVAAAAFAAFGSIGSAAASRGPDGGEQTHQGVVQLVTTRGVVLKELDGSIVTIPIDAGTRVLVNGKPALLRDVRPGYVAASEWRSGRRAEILQTVDPGRASSSGSQSSGNQGGGSQTGTSGGGLQGGGSQSGGSHGKSTNGLRLPAYH